MTKIACHTLNIRQRSRYDPEGDGGWGAWIPMDMDDVWTMPDDDDDDSSEMESFCCCCGARYIAETTEKTRAYAKWGIDVYAGHIDTPGIRKGREKNVSVAHINTKAGPLTAAIWIEK